MVSLIPRKTPITINSFTSPAPNIRSKTNGNKIIQTTIPDTNHIFTPHIHLVALLGEQLVNLCGCLAFEDAGAVGGALQGTVVGQVQDAVRGAADIGFKAGVSGIPAVLEGLGCVFVAFKASSAVGEGADALVLCEGTCCKAESKEDDKYLFHSAKVRIIVGFSIFVFQYETFSDRRPRAGVQDVLRLPRAPHGEFQGGGYVDPVRFYQISP